MTHKMKPSGKGRPKIVILNLDQFDLWPCFSTDKTHRVSQTLQKAYHLTRLDKRPHAEALQGPESRVSSLLEYCRTQKLSQKVTKGLLRAGIDSLTSLGLLRTEDVANMTFVDKTEDALRLKMAIVKLRTEQPLDPVYSLGHQLAVEKSKVSSSSRMDFLDLAKSPKVRSVQAKLPARKPTMLVRSTFGSNSPKPKKTRLSPNKTKKQYRSLLAYKTCTNCENTFTALYKNWHLCQGCHEQQRMRWVHIPPQGSHHPNRDWLGRSTSPPHDVLSSGSLSSSDSSGYLSSSSRGHRESSVFYCPNYGCHFFGKKLDDLEVTDFYLFTKRLRNGIDNFVGSHHADSPADSDGARDRNHESVNLGVRHHDRGRADHRRKQARHGAYRARKLLAEALPHLLRWAPLLHGLLH